MEFENPLTWLSNLVATEDGRHPSTDAVESFFADAVVSTNEAGQLIVQQ